MLILTRRRNESIVIGDGDDAVTITVTGVRGDTVRLGVVAPRGVEVNRQEIYDAKIKDGRIRSRRPDARGHEAPSFIGHPVCRPCDPVAAGFCEP